MKRKTFLLLLTLMLTTAASAQTRLVLTTNDGSEHHYAIEQSGGIYFSDTEIEVRENLGNGANDTYSLADVKKLAFEHPTGIEASASTEIRLYPNPAHHTLRVDGLTGNETARIYDLMGRLVAESKQASSIDISRLAPGMYVVRIDERTMRFIKQ